jgi:hypothetical protein
MHLVGFIIGIYHDARSHERQIRWRSQKGLRYTFNIKLKSQLHLRLWTEETRTSRLYTLPPPKPDVN